MSLADYIPTGRENACCIADLVYATGLTDRAVRQEIERLVVEDHIPICTLPTLFGVFVAETPEEVDLAQRQIRSRAGALLRRARALRIAGERVRWSPTLFDVEALR